MRLLTRPVSACSAEEDQGFTPITALGGPDFWNSAHVINSAPEVLALPVYPLKLSFGVYKKHDSKLGFLP